MKFDRTRAHKKLTKQAKKALKLNKKGFLTPERLHEYCSDFQGLQLLYGMEKVDEKVLNHLFELATEMKVMDKMKRLQRLEVMNFVEGVKCENRQVGHTAVRHLFDQKFHSKEEEMAANLAGKEIAKLKLFLEHAENRNIKHVIAIGIGGSYLGGMAIHEALKGLHTPKRSLHYISNVDPDQMSQVVSEVDLQSSIVLVISKSGSTLEIKTNETALRKVYEGASLNPDKYFVAITGKGSPMDNTSRYLESFYIWDYIGGRYSVSSMVGIVPLALTLGLDVVMEFLRGMSDMDHNALDKNPKRNLPLMGALLKVWNRDFLSIPTVGVIPYSAAMWRYSAHLQQLMMESNGKSIDQEGKSVSFPTSPIFWGEPGTDGQHSFFQCLHQGTDPVSIEFIGFKECQHESDPMVEGTTSQEKLLSNLFAQSLGLALGKKSDNPNTNFVGDRPSRILLAEKLDAHMMGLILAYHEHVAAYFGFLLGINSFDQEGVQLGKVMANNIIALFKLKHDDRRMPTDEENQLPLAMLDHLDRLHGVKKPQKKKRTLFRPKQVKRA